MPEEVRKYKDQLESRAMLVKKAKVIPLEAIVRGYLTGGRDPVPDSRFVPNLISLNRLCLVGIQEERDNSRNPDAFRSHRISTAPLSPVYTFNEG